MSKLLYTGSEWTIDLVEKVWKVIDSIAREKYGLEYYPPSIEIISARQMIDRCSTHAMPVFYNHWSFGKSAMQMENDYREGKSSLAYEVVINTSPSRAYIMEDNTMTMQALVLAHSVCGHASFFKNNYLFKKWTDAEFIEDYLVFARNYIKDCEEEYGSTVVEKWLDACHSIAYNGIDKYPRSREKRAREKEAQRVARLAYEQETYNDLWANTLPKDKQEETERSASYPWPYPEENLLYFIEKNAPMLEDWQKEIIRIVRKTTQYFYPQIQTKIMNEGWASFWHYQLMTDLLDEGYIDEGSYLEFLESHTGVVNQPDMVVRLNPYYMGYNIFKDIKRMCENPTDEDREWFPDIAGGDWLETVKDVMENYRDESFIRQFLSPKVVRDMKMMAVEDDSTQPEMEVTNIAEKEDFEDLRKKLANSYSFDSFVPQIEVMDYDYEKSRALLIRHNPERGQTLDEDSAKEVMKYIKYLWGPYPVTLQTITQNGEQKLMTRRHE